MKINKFSIAGICFGIFLAVASTIRYWIVYPDYDKALFFFLVGVLIIAVSWHQQRLINQGHSIEAMENWISDKVDAEKNEV